MTVPVVRHPHIPARRGPLAPCLQPADPHLRPRDGEATARALAWRLYVKHRDAQPALLEALAATDREALVAGLLALGQPPELDAATAVDPAWVRCLEIARRAVAGKLHWLLAGARRYHRAGAAPAWAEGLTPIAEVEGFLFYRIGE